jgi:hypothetical protein
MRQRSTAPGVGVVALLLVVSPYAGRSAASPQSRPESRLIDPAAVAVLRAMDDAFAAAQGLVATYRKESFKPAGLPSSTETVTLRLGRPNIYEVRIDGNGPAPRRVLASDGRKRYYVIPGTDSPQCLVSAVAPLNDQREIDTFNPLYWSFYDLGEWQIRSAVIGHWSTRWRLADPGLRALRYAGRDTLDGRPVDLVEWSYTIGYNRADDDPVYTSRLSIGLDRFVRRIETTSTSQRTYESRRTVETVTDLETTALQPASTFAYTPPVGAKCAAHDQEAVYTTGRYSDLPVGSQAPDFTLGTARGETLAFSAFLKQHKVVLMNYWGYG